MRHRAKVRESVESGGRGRARNLRNFTLLHIVVAAVLGVEISSPRKANVESDRTVCAALLASLKSFDISDVEVFKNFKAKSSLERDKIQEIFTFS